MVSRKPKPVAIPAASLLNNPRAAQMNAHLTRLVEESAEPDVAWMWRNDRPGPLTEWSIPEHGRPSPETTVFFPSADVRGLYLPDRHWELMSEVLQARFLYWCEKRYDPPHMDKHQVENKVGLLSSIAWAIELIENRRPVAPEGMEELQMHWGSWFGLLNLQLEAATHSCPGPMLGDYIGAVFTLRTQCCPRNRQFLTGSEARESAPLELQRIRELRQQQREQAVRDK